MANLNIYINGASSAMGATGIATYGSGIGKIAFDPIAKLIYVNGVGYGLSNEQYDNLFGEGEGSFESKIADIIDDINNHNTDISNLQTDVAGLQTGVAGLQTGVAGLQTGVAGLRTDVDTLGSLTGVVASLTGTVAGLTSTVAGLRTDVDKKIESINGITGTNVNIGADKINYLEATEATGAISIKTKIDQIVSSIDTLTNTDLSKVNTAIQEIKRELSSGDGADLANTLIDKLSTFLGGKTSWTINGVSKTNIEEIISALESFATGAAQAAQQAAETFATGAAQAAQAAAETYALQAATSAASTAETNAKKYADGLASNYDAAGAAITGVATVIGTSGDGAGVNTIYGAKAYANSLASNYDVAGAATTGVATVIGTSNDGTGVNTIYGAKAYADAAAQSAAGQVISWEVIGS